MTDRPVHMGGTAGGQGGAEELSQLRASYGGEKINIEWVKPQGLVALSFVIAILRVLTLGLYHFWGKTEVRRRIWSGIRLNGQPLEYTGRGLELLLGFLIVFGVVFLPFLVLIILAGPGAAEIVQLFFLPIFFYLIGVAQYRARRYRLSRTNWRGIRGGMAGSPWAFGWIYIGTALLIPMTMGWITPWRNTLLYDTLTNETRFGDRPLKVNASSGPLYLPYTGFWFGQIIIYGLAIVVGYYWLGPDLEAFQGRPPEQIEKTALALFAVKFYGLLALVALLRGVIGAFYKVREYNYLVGETLFEGARFQLKTQARTLIPLVVTNWLMVIGTLGILTPVAQARLVGYFVDRLALIGPVNVAEIAQSQQSLSRTGEGLAEAFDIDGF